MSGGERKEEEEGEEGRGLVGRPRLAAVSVVWHKNRQEMNPLKRKGNSFACCYGKCQVTDIQHIVFLSVCSYWPK